MKIYQSETTDPVIPGLILCSHGPFAIGLLQSLEMLAGNASNLSAFSLEPGDDVNVYRQAIVSQLEAYPKGSIVFVDLFGGTPCNQMLQYVQESGHVIEMVSGMNLPMLLSAVIMRKTLKGSDLSVSLIADGKQSVDRIDIEKLLLDEEDED